MNIATIQSINQAINRPEVLSGFLLSAKNVEDTLLDLSHFYDANPGNLALQTNEGIMLFCPVRKEYECHACFYPEFSGKLRLLATRQMLQWVFTRKKPIAIVCWPPRDNRAARHMSTLLGFRPTGKVKTDTLGRECLEYRLERESWEM